MDKFSYLSNSGVEIIDEEYQKFKKRFVKETKDDEDHSQNERFERDYQQMKRKLVKDGIIDEE